MTEENKTAESEYIRRTLFNRILFISGTEKQIWIDGFETAQTLLKEESAKAFEAGRERKFDSDRIKNDKPAFAPYIYPTFEDYIKEIK